MHVCVCNVCQSKWSFNLLNKWECIQIKSKLSWFAWVACVCSCVCGYWVTPTHSRTQNVHTCVCVNDTEWVSLSLFASPLPLRQLLGPFYTADHRNLLWEVSAHMYAPIYSIHINVHILFIHTRVFPYLLNYHKTEISSKHFSIHKKHQRTRQNCVSAQIEVNAAVVQHCCFCDDEGYSNFTICANLQKHFWFVLAVASSAASQTARLQSLQK